MQNNVNLSYKGPVEYSIEMALEKIDGLLKHTYKVSKRTIGTLLLKEDPEIKNLVEEKEPEVISQIQEIIEEVKAHLSQPVEYLVSVEQREEAVALVNRKSFACSGRMSMEMAFLIHRTIVLFCQIHANWTQIRMI